MTQRASDAAVPVDRSRGSPEETKDGARDAELGRRLVPPLLRHLFSKCLGLDVVADRDERSADMRRAHAGCRGLECVSGMGEVPYEAEALGAVPLHPSG